MAYTTINKSTSYFNTKLYTGTGAEHAITGIGFQPDFIWLKKRTESGHHFVQDAVRGATYQLRTSANNAENNYSQYVKSIQSDGFTLGTDNDVNKNTIPCVAWNWKAGTSFSNDASATGVGTIDSTGSVSTTAGFSIVSYTGTGSAGTVAHGLGSAPQVVIVKERSSADSWHVGHAGIGFTKNLYLNLSNAENTETAIFNDTAPTSSVFSLGNNSGINASSSTYIVYCFAEKKGYSKFGSYTGNGNADGTFVYTGFSPSFVITKNANISDWWGLWDNKRLGLNSSDSPRLLQPNLQDAEPTSKLIDFTSNGFKIRSSNGAINGSGNKVIYMAFGQSLVGSNNVPCTAR